MKRSIFLLIAACLPFLPAAQIITTQPETVTEEGEVTIVFNAAEGNKGLMGFTGEVYAHTGVITDRSGNDTDWQYAPTWGDNSPKYKLSPLGGDTWELKIAPDIRTYYGVAEGETVVKLAFVFRSADKTKEGKGVGNTDIFVLLNAASFTPAEPVEKARPGGIADGINYIDDTTATLLLFAPGKKHVHLLGDFNHWTKDNDYQLYRDGDYWWYTLTALEKGKEYGFQYLVDNSFKIADAYATKILDPWNDASIPQATYPDIPAYPSRTEGIVSILQTGQQPYAWKSDRHSPVPKEQLVIYELLIRDFTTDGTIRAAASRLDYLQSLGVNAIELMPIQEFDGNDSWGYNPCFFFAADKAYGTPADYKAFIDEAHSRGMAVILDVVFNHATGQHPFAMLYWEGSAPAADNPWFNVEAPHPYSVFNDFNHEYAGTRAFFKRVLAHWLNEYKVDGFRFDLTKGFTQKASTEVTASAYDASRIAILKDYNEHIRSIRPETYVILEHFCENREELELAQAGMMLWNNTNNAYCQSAMGYPENSSLTAGSYTYRGWSLPALVTYAESHDEERMMYKAKTWGKWTLPDDNALRMQRAALASAFLLSTPGPKMIWQFGELGYDISIDQNGRTGRKPVLWSYYDDPDRRALYDTYSTLLRFRSENPELFASPSTVDMQTSTADWNGGRAIRLTSGDKALVLLGNFVETAVDIPAGFTSAGTWQELFSGQQITVGEAGRNQAITLPPHSFRLYTTDGTPTGVEEIAHPPVRLAYSPSAQRLTIHTTRPIEHVRLYTLTGRLAATHPATTTIDLHPLPPGLYIIQVQTPETTYHEKLVKR